GLTPDAAAVEVARALGAVKLIYLTITPGIMRRQNGQDELLRQLAVEEAETILKKHGSELVGASLSKLVNAVRAARGGVPRVHIIDGRVDEGLLAEVFSNEGIGTLIHANEYQAIRPAHKKDARAIHALILPGMQSDELLRRTRADIEKQIEDFVVLEIDRT